MIFNMTQSAQQMPIGSMFLLPPAPDKCQVCATAHEPFLPHNAQSLYYQIAFNMQHGRAPTWIDAMEHCADDIRFAWQAELERMGVDVMGGKINPDKGAKAEGRA